MGDKAAQGTQNATSNSSGTAADDLRYVCYGKEKESPYLPAIKQLISKDLSEPYSIYVYRYFLYQWGDLCFMALDSSDTLIGVIVCKLEPHRGGPLRGYIAMLATQAEHRGKGIAGKLVRLALDAMKAQDADEIALETEVDNIPSLRIYEKLGFIRTKRLHRYYLSGTSAFRLILYLKEGIPYMMTYPPEYGGEMGYGDEGREGYGGGMGLREQDLIERQAAQMRIEDAYDESHDVRGV
ncbi:N-alpha-acetyltransferase 30 [Fulvia fulva]|uniref:N-alpha-acetyltransferase 30 n=1 Tax=Passalora fulva TaxID=5499 RepID=A0A9Q8UTF0_PASFU|nr:N-alpha-acetyltransferase 30 [Fulvia fulva]KAK4614224.1 N-alpha-acetyltransferase 30 [Fulvia fulva]KAK4614718.1 N-alpha-acetyltransferase 30 [Fulvia fulva]UJO21717.1 N-alpha-acetyltransferase 30 [Fulvia fulva]WPV19836.1 N-alpha-acetyltransferase 30 [Fulvia fulva]WPV35731.1 N-alpha-acetyltransferase 30 [Fulvia fulva]